MGKDELRRADNASSLHSAAVARKPEGVFGRGRRISGYLFWYVLATLPQQGLPQLVLFPLCLHLIGSENFGKFVYALGMIRIVNLAPARGLRNALFRTIAGLTEEGRSLLMRTTFALALGAVSGICLLAILGCLGAWVSGAAESELALWTAILILAVGAQNLILVTTSDLPVRRRFAQSALWESIGSVLVFLALPGILLIGQWGLPIGYTVGYLTALALLLLARHRTLLGTPQFDKGMAKRVSMTWAVLSTSALLFGSGPYILRTGLGSWGSYEAVSVFYASVATVQLIAAPVVNLGAFGLRLVSAHTSKESLSPRLLRWYPVAAVMAAVCFYGLVSWAAPWLVHRLYPAVADSALEPISIIAPGVAVSILISAARPLVVKFSPRRALLTIGIVTMGTHLACALLLIPPWGLIGAAWAYCIGASVSGLTWFGFLLAGIVGPGESADRVASGDGIDSGPGRST